MEFTFLVFEHLIDPLDVPSGTFSISICSNNDVVFVLRSEDLASFIVELVTFKSEELEPSGIGFPNLHVVGFSRVLDVP